MEDEIYVDNHEGGSHQEEETRPVQDDPNPNHEDPPGYDDRIPDEGEWTRRHEAFRRTAGVWSAPPVAGEGRAAVEEGGPAHDPGGGSDEGPWRGEQGGEGGPTGRARPPQE